MNGAGKKQDPTCAGECDCKGEDPVTNDFNTTKDAQIGEPRLGCTLHVAVSAPSNVRDHEIGRERADQETSPDATTKLQLAMIRATQYRQYPRDQQQEYPSRLQCHKTLKRCYHPVPHIEKNFLWFDSMTTPPETPVRTWRPVLVEDDEDDKPVGQRSITDAPVRPHRHPKISLADQEHLREDERMRALRGLGDGEDDHGWYKDDDESSSSSGEERSAPDDFFEDARVFGLTFKTDIPGTLFDDLYETFDRLSWENTKTWANGDRHAALYAQQVIYPLAEPAVYGDLQVAATILKKLSAQLTDRDAIAKHMPSPLLDAWNAGRPFEMFDGTPTHAADLRNRISELAKEMDSTQRHITWTLETMLESVNNFTKWCNKRIPYSKDENDAYPRTHVAPAIHKRPRFVKRLKQRRSRRHAR